ncbi:MAG: hypothetical protein Q8P01_05320 [bacterium]|nr:hypothetical protein [bacterium]
MGKPKLISLVVVLLGIAVAFYVTSQNNPSPSPAELGASLETSGALTYKDFLKQFPLTKTLGSSSENVTDKVIKEYGEELFRLNQDKTGGKPVSPSQVVAPSEEFLNTLVTQELGGLLPIPLFTIQDVRTSSNNTEKGLAAYFTSYQQITQENLRGITPSFLAAAEEAVAKSRVTSLNAHISAAEREVRDLLQLEVPEKLAPLHIELLNMWQRRLVIGRALQERDDPLKRVVALNSLSQAMDLELGLEFMVQLASHEK